MPSASNCGTLLLSRATSITGRCRSTKTRGSKGWSRPEDNLPEPPSTIEVSSDLPPERQTLIAFDQKGEFKGESSGEELYQPRGRGMRVFLASCIAAIAISVVGYFALRAIDPSRIWRSAENTALRPTTREA